jgi:hypothetical protein
MWAPWAVGGAGAAVQLAVLGLYLGTQHRAEKLTQLQPTEAGSFIERKTFSACKAWSCRLPWQAGHS